MIETDRLIIRDFTFDDLETVHSLVQDPDIYKYQHWGPNSYEDTKNYIKMCIDQQSETPRKSFELCITDKATGDFIGAIGIRIKSTSSKNADLGYWVRKDKWGNGIGTEATRGIIKFGFNDLKMNRIWATVSPENISSIRVLEKSGMKKEGLMRQDMFVRGEYRDSVLMAIILEDFRGSK